MCDWLCNLCTSPKEDHYDLLDRDGSPFIDPLVRSTGIAAHQVSQRVFQSPPDAHVMKFPAHSPRSWKSNRSPGRSPGSVSFRSPASRGAETPTDKSPLSKRDLSIEMQPSPTSTVKSAGSEAWKAQDIEVMSTSPDV